MRLRVALVLGAGLAAGAAAVADEIPRVPVLVPPSLPAEPPTPAPLPVVPATPKTAPAGGVTPAAAVSKVVATPAAGAKSPEAFAQTMADAKVAYARLRDYSGHYVRRERVAGKVVPEQTCELRVRTSPFAASLKVVSPREFAGRETVFSAKTSASKVLFKEAGKVAHQKLPADAPAVLSDTSHQIADVGLMAVLARVEQAVALERRLNNPVQVIGGDFVFDGKPCVRWEVYCDRPHARRYAAKHVLYVDKETKLPVRYEAYDAPKAGGPAGGEAFEVQSFVGLKFNTGLGEAAFER